MLNNLKFYTIVLLLSSKLLLASDVDIISFDKEIANASSDFNFDSFGDYMDCEMIYMKSKIEQTTRSNWQMNPYCDEITKAMQERFALNLCENEFYTCYNSDKLLFTDIYIFKQPATGDCHSICCFFNNKFDFLLQHIQVHMNLTEPITRKLYRSFFRIDFESSDHAAMQLKYLHTRNAIPDFIIEQISKLANVQNLDFRINDKYSIN